MKQVIAIPTGTGLAVETSRWWAENRAAVTQGTPQNYGQLLTTALRDGLLDLPLPGSGDTQRRFAALAALGRADPVLARLGEGHADAVAILAELGGPDPGRGLWGVWAAMPASLTAEQIPTRWLLTGDRPWCSGAGCCGHALVTAATGDGIRLFAVDLSDPTVTRLDGTWPAVGMAGSDSRTVRFDATPAMPVGQAGQYVQRPGFWAGAAGVAACWYGGSVGVADQLRSKAEHDPYALAHLGAIDAALAGTRALLNEVASTIDSGTQDLARPAQQVRAMTEWAATEVLDRVGRALGAGPLCRSPEHARRVADLTVYLRQSHAEKDLAGLGAATAAAAEPGW